MKSSSSVHNKKLRATTNNPNMSTDNNITCNPTIGFLISFIQLKHLQLYRKVRR